MPGDRIVTRWISNERGVSAVDEKLSISDDVDLDSNLTSNESKNESGIRFTNIETPSKMNRLIVLIPDQDVDEVKISRKILSQAFSRRLDIVLVTLVYNAENEYMARRRLATMMTLLRGPQLKVETKVSLGHSWVKVVDQLIQNRDMIFCPAELTELSFLGTRKPLEEILKRGLNLPIVTYAGLYHDTHINWLNFIYHAGQWIILSAILLLFLIFEIDLNLFVMGWKGQILAFIIVIIEIGVFYYWMSIRG